MVFAPKKKLEAKKPEPVEEVEEVEETEEVEEPVEQTKPVETYEPENKSVDKKEVKDLSLQEILAAVESHISRAYQLLQVLK